MSMNHLDIKFIKFLFLGLCLLTACASETQEDASEEETYVAPSHMQIMQMGIQKLPQWVDHWEMQGREFSKTAFTFEQEYQYETMELPEENSMEAGYPLKKFQFSNPEEKGTVDIYDYKLEIDPEGKVALNPDGEVSYFRSNGMKERLLFIGPGGVFEDAVWITGEHLLIAGHFQEDETFTPKLWLIMPEKNVYMQYENPFTTTEYKSESYLKKKLSTISFDE